MEKKDTLYETNVEPFLDEIVIMKMEGKTDIQICEHLGISDRSFRTYKKKHKELRDIMKEGNIKLTENIHASIFKRALGYVDSEGKDVPPNMKAAEMSLLILKQGIEYDNKKLSSDEKKLQLKFEKVMNDLRIEEQELKIKVMKEAVDGGNNFLNNVTFNFSEDD